MGFNVIWFTAHEVSLVDHTLLVILLFKRATAAQADASSSGGPFPPTQQNVTNALGLSLVPTNNMLRKLERRGLDHLGEGRLYMRDGEALAHLADLHSDGRPPVRPRL